MAWPKGKKRPRSRKKSSAATLSAANSPAVLTSTATTELRDPESFDYAVLADELAVTRAEANSRIGLLTQRIDAMQSERDGLYLAVTGIEAALGMNQLPGAVGVQRR